MTNGRPEIVTDENRWGYVAGARFVSPDEWEKSVYDHIGRPLYLQAVAEGLALAADSEGQIINYRPNEFYAGALSDSMRNEDDPKSWKLTYDRFSASVLLDAMSTLLFAGLLATRGNGDSVDYRLTLPAEA